MTVAEFVLHYLAVMHGRVARQTYRTYEWALRTYVLPTLGERRLDTIGRGDIRRFVDELYRKGVLRKSTLRLVVQVLRGLLSYAVEEELIVANPARHPGKLVRMPKRAIRPALAGDAQRRFLLSVHQLAPHMYVLFLFLCRTGCRLGEAIGMTWDAIDLHERIALIRQQTWPNGRVGTVKNGREHYVDLSAQLVMALRQHKRAVDGPWVFPGPTGFPYGRQNVGHHFRRAARLAGLPEGLTIHSLRHAFASTLLRRGEPLQYVQRALDHGDPKLTASLYGSALPNSRHSAVDALDD
jgi:integrase